VQSDTPPVPVSKKRLWAGRIISALVVLFLPFDGIVKVMKIAPVLQSFARLDILRASLSASESCYWLVLSSTRFRVLPSLVRSC